MTHHDFYISGGLASWMLPAGGGGSRVRVLDVAGRWSWVAAADPWLDGGSGGGEHRQEICINLHLVLLVIYFSMLAPILLVCPFYTCASLVGCRQIGVRGSWDGFIPGCPRRGQGVAASWLR